MSPRIDALDAAAAGPRLIARRPLAVFVWGLLTVGYVGAVALVMFDAMSDIVATPEPEAPGPMLAESLRLQMLMGPLNAMALVLQGVLGAAVFRAVLTDRADRFLHLRLGLAELLLIVVQVALGVGLWVALAVPVLVLAALSFALWSVNDALGVAAAAIGGVAILGLVAWLLLRTALIAPMTVADRQLRFVEGWRLTRGHVAGLLGVGLLTALMLLILQLGVLAIAGGVALSSPAWGEAFMAAARDEPRRLLPVLVAAAAPASVIVGAGLSLTLAPWAAAYRQIAVGEGRDAAVAQR